MTDPDVAELSRRLGCPRLMELGDPGHPDYRPGYEAVARRMLAGLPATPERPAPAATPAYPPAATQVGNALAALTRVATAAVTGAPVAVPDAERDRRLAVCRGCDRFDAAAGRCTECGCWTAAKAALATEHCPLAKW